MSAHDDDYLQLEVEALDALPPDVGRRWFGLLAALTLLLLALVTLASRALLVGPVHGELALGLPADVHTLVIGASHAACALDPDVFAGPTGRALSVARHGELMVSTRAKLAALLGDAPGLRRVLLTVSPIHLGVWQDEHLLGGNAHSRAQIMEYYPLFDEATRVSLPAWQGDVLLARLKYDVGVPLGVTDELALYARHLRGTLRPWHHPFWGGFTPLDGQHLDADLVERVVERYFLVDGVPAGRSQRATRALEEIVELTASAGVQLVLVDAPAHARFRAASPPGFREALDVLLDRCAARPHVTVLRDAALDLPDEAFLDPDHLNRRGAAAYSRLVADRLGVVPGPGGGREGAGGGGTARVAGDDVDSEPGASSPVGDGADHR